MKRSLITLTLLAASTSGAHAQSMYAGIAYSSFSGENVYVGPVDSDEYELVGEVAEIFIGADCDMGSYILGGEASIVTGAVYEEGYEDEYQFTSIVDLKGRLGFDAGQFMPYGVLGLSAGTFEDKVGDSETQFGVIAGLGADVAVSTQFKVGLEFTSRAYNFEGLYNDGDIESRVNSASLRGSFRF
ncbi:outer membrane beta-barrel protein [Loktanella agnita]|uniref:outer membrane beta-barrel protein n=1 Tax=Loktanella agnita TaxID=287097 RepID=UPI0039893D3B